MNRFKGLAGLLIAAAVLTTAKIARTGPAEIQDTYANAFGAFLQGKTEGAASAYRYISTLNPDDVSAVVNQALIARDLNKPDEALPLWIKASLQAPTDAFIWNQRGWCLLSMERYREARQAFEKAVSVSSITVWMTEGQFGLAMTEEMDGSPKNAINILRKAFTGSPYLFPAVSAELGRLSLITGPISNAELYFKQSLNQDPIQPDVTNALGRVYDKTRIPKAAWFAYKATLDLSPGDEEAAKGLERAAGYIHERPERLLPVRRLAAPLVQKAVAMPDSTPIRVGLFANPAGDLAYGKRTYVMSGSDFRVIDVQLGEVARGKGDEQWEIVMPPEGRVVEIRDVHHQLQYTTKQAFWIEPVEKGATVLIKSVELADIKGVDIGDRELRGRLEVMPTPFGFQMINEIGIEEYLYSIVAAAMPRGSPDDALMAQAIVSRTRFESSNRHEDPSLKIHFCDSTHCQIYAGLTEEREDSTQAVLATFGGKLYRAAGEGVFPARGTALVFPRGSGELYPVRQHPYCGWSTEEGVMERPDGKPSVRSVADLERLTHGYPDPDQYCELSPLPTPSWSRWLRVFDEQTLRAHAEKTQYIGKLAGLTVLRRTRTGRIEAMEVAGTRGKFVLEGQKAVADFFSAGGMRSALFTLQPLYDGKILSRVLVWGAGTGDGQGLCTAGTLGMAHAGKEFGDILRHYFSGSEIKGMNPKVTIPKKKPYAEPKETTEELLKRNSTVEAERMRKAGRLRRLNRMRAKQRREEADLAVSSATANHKRPPIHAQKGPLPKKLKPAAPSPSDAPPQENAE